MTHKGVLTLINYDLSIIIKNFIGLFTDYFCSIYIYTILSKLKITKNRVLYLTISSIAIPAIATFLRISNNPFYGIVFYIISILSIVVLNSKEYKTIIPTMSIALGIQYFAELLSIILLVTVFLLFNYFKTNIFTEICTSVLQFTIVFFIMKIRRLKNGLNFLQDKKNFGIGLFISGPVVILTCLQKDYMSDNLLSFVAIGITISSIGLIFWLRSAITHHYRKRLKLRAEEYSKLELAEKSREIEKLSDENTSLSSIIHLDNQIIQTIETELNKLNNTEPTNKLLISINQRNDYVNSVLIKSINLASTGNAGVDAVLLDLYIKAASRGIDFNLNTDCDINYLINNIITKNDFEALLRELITNSIIAVENNPEITGRISINISQPNDIYELTIMDNGIFKDNNNSIPDTIEKSKASITTNHFENNDSFTKSVTIRFDGLNMSERIFSKQRHTI